MLSYLIGWDWDTRTDREGVPSGHFPVIRYYSYQSAATEVGRDVIIRPTFVSLISEEGISFAAT